VGHVSKEVYSVLSLFVVASVVVISLVGTTVFSPARADTPCGTSASPPIGGYQHIVEIIEENQSYSKIIGTSGSKQASIAPYINSLASQCGLATGYHSIMHPSLPNYLALTAGDTLGVTKNILPTARSASVSASSIYDQQITSASLMESMPSPCYKRDADPYAAHHNPQLYFADQQVTCLTNDQPLLVDAPDLSAAFTLIAPNECDDMHDSQLQFAGCPSGDKITNGDIWLQNFMQKIYASPQWLAGNTVVFITWDEGTKKLPNGEDSHVPTIVVAPSVVPGTQDSTPWTHYSLLNTVEGLLGQPCLAHACEAGDMSTSFNLK
jgi:phosphatidylinositol-3-phosphatase